MSRRRVRQTVLRLDSAHRSSGTNNAPEFFLEQRLSNVHMVELRKVMLPNTDYPVNSGNNTFLWDDGALAPLTTTILPGSYTAAEYGTALGTQMTLDATDGETYAVAPAAGGDKAGRFELVKTGAPTMSITGGTSLPMNGFGNGQNGAAVIPLLATNVFDMSGPNYVLVRSIDLVNGSTDFSHYSGPKSGSTNTTNVLEAVYKTGNFGSSILTDYNTKLRQPFHGILSGIQLELSYPDSTPVDLNGRPWMVELRVRHSR